MPIHGASDREYDISQDYLYVLSEIDILHLPAGREHAKTNRIQGWTRFAQSFREPSNPISAESNQPFEGGKGLIRYLDRQRLWHAIPSRTLLGGSNVGANSLKGDEIRAGYLTLRQ